MIVSGTRAGGAARRRAAPAMGVVFHKGEWMDSGDDPTLSPTVSLIEQPAGFEFMPHFHRQNQFQVFVGGSGRLGRQSLVPVVVHYAGAYTGYGPLVAGPEGLQYFTLRPVCEAGFIPLTERQEKMIPGPKRHAHSEGIEVASPDEMRGWTQVREDFVIPLGEDGLGARLVQLPPHRTWSCGHPAGSQGQFLFMLAGTLTAAGHALGRWEQVYATYDEPMPMARAGDGGAQLLMLSVPRKAAPYRDGAPA
jgi:hypothetical protein